MKVCPGLSFIWSLGECYKQGHSDSSEVGRGLYEGMSRFIIYLEFGRGLKTGTVRFLRSRERIIWKHVQLYHLSGVWERVITGTVRFLRSRERIIWKHVQLYHLSGVWERVITGTLKFLTFRWKCGKGYMQGWSFVTFIWRWERGYIYRHPYLITFIWGWGGGIISTFSMYLWQILFHDFCIAILIWSLLSGNGGDYLYI